MAEIEEHEGAVSKRTGHTRQGTPGQQLPQLHLR